MSSDQPLSPLTDDELRKRRVPLQRKISLKFKEFRGFITEHSANISMGGMFIRTESPQPPGTIFDFEFTLGDGYTLIHGIGEVVWVRERDEGPDRPAGMGVRFLNLDPESRQLVDRIVLERLRKEGPSGLPVNPGPEPWEAPPDPEDDALDEVEPEEDLDSWNMGRAPAAVSAPVPSPPTTSEPHAFRLFDEDEPEAELGAELPTESLAVPGPDEIDTAPAAPADPADPADLADPVEADDDAWELADEADELDEPYELDGDDDAEAAADAPEQPDEALTADADDDWRLSQPPTPSAGVRVPPLGVDDDWGGDDWGDDVDPTDLPDLDDSSVVEPPPVAVAAPPVTEVPRPGVGERVPLAYSRSRAGSVPPQARRSRRPYLLAALGLVVVALAVFLAVPSSARDSLFASLGFAGAGAGVGADGDGDGEGAPLVAERPAADPSAAAAAAVADGPETAARRPTDGEAETDPEAATDDQPTPGVLAVADADGNVREVEQDDPPVVPQAPREEPLADPIPASGPFGRLLGITWQESGDRTVVILQLDGKIEEWNYSTAALSGPPRALVRLQGATGRYAGGAAEVGDSRVERVRVGYHPGSSPGTSDDELHVVVDLAAADVRLATTDATGAELRLVFARGAGDG